jgi:hypothetical protein
MFDVIVSLTTWKGRINTQDVKHNIFDLLTKQKTQYKYKVVLCLSEEEFPTKEKEIPSWINDLNEFSDNFELLWTYKNTKALKKLNPAMKKYSDLPIISIDDDEKFKANAIETFMNYHKQNPNIILSECGINEIYENIYTTGAFRLYPPNSLADLDEQYFIDYFKTSNDDLFNAIRAVMKGTKTKMLHTKCVLTVYAGTQKNNLYSVYSKINWSETIKKFESEVELPNFKENCGKPQKFRWI